MSPRPMSSRGIPTPDEVLEPEQILVLEAFADTVIPGVKRGAGDLAIVGVSKTAGAVECGALSVLVDPATGIDDGVAEMADLLEAAAQDYRQRHRLGRCRRAFLELDYEHRRRLVTELTTERWDKDLWFLLAMFCYMAYDSSPHRPTAEVVRDPSSGLAQMGFEQPPLPGRLDLRPGSYGAGPLARLHPLTTERGDLP